VSPDLERLLALVPAFACLRVDERVRVAGQMKWVTLSAGQQFALSGDAPPLVLVAAGELWVRRGAEVSVVFPGDMLGEVEVLAGRGAGETVEAREDSALAVLDRAAVETLLEEFPVIARPWVSELGRELKWRNDLLREILLARSQGWAAERLAGVLARRRRRLQRHRHHPIRRVGALLARVLIVEPSQRPTFWMFAGVVLALASARTVVAMILKNGLQQKLFALIGSEAGNPIHVHHFNYGLLLVSSVGLVSMLPSARRSLRLLSFTFGFGVGLVVDEFALLWNLNPDYYQASSRLMAGAVVFALVQAVYFRKFYSAIGRRLLAAVFS